MKALSTVCGIVMVLLAASAFGDTINITNQGLVSGAGSGGVTAFSAVNGVNGISVSPGGSIQFDTGSFTGSILTGGVFSSGDLTLNVLGATIFASDFAGNWLQLSDNQYGLLGTFTSGGIHGVTIQLFEVQFGEAGICLRDLEGNTTISSVPEPGTLTLLGTGLVSVSARRKRRKQFAEVRPTFCDRTGL
jgi:hypothetical protein